MPVTVLSMQNIYLVKKNYANPPEGDTKPPEDSASMKFVYHQLNTNPHKKKIILDQDWFLKSHVHVYYIDW